MIENSFHVRKYRFFTIILLILTTSIKMAFAGSKNFEGEYIVIIKKEHDILKLIDNDFVIKSIFKQITNGFSAKLSEQQFRKLKKDPRVKLIEKNGAVFITGRRDKSKNNPDINVGVSTVPQILPDGVTRVGGPFDGRGKSVWLLDTGVDENNSDLIVGLGANFVFDRKGKLRNSYHDNNGHGTHVAGVIAALDNDIDSVGVAAGATIHPIRVLGDDGIGSVDTVLKGLDYVAERAKSGDVVNLSLAASGHYESLHQAIAVLANKGILFSLAAGNNSDHASDYEPAHVDHENVYTISAVDTNDTFATFSNFGNPPIDYSAPGVNIKSLRIGGGLVSYSGTSMAAPHVTGLLLIFNKLSYNGVAKNDPDGMADFIVFH